MMITYTMEKLAAGSREDRESILTELRARFEEYLRNLSRARVIPGMAEDREKASLITESEKNEVSKFLNTPGVAGILTDDEVAKELALYDSYFNSNWPDTSPKKKPKNTADEDVVFDKSLAEYIADDEKILDDIVRLMRVGLDVSTKEKLAEVGKLMDQTAYDAILEDLSDQEYELIAERALNRAVETLSEEADKILAPPPPAMSETQVPPQPPVKAPEYDEFESLFEDTQSSSIKEPSVEPVSQSTEAEPPPAEPAEPAEPSPSSFGGIDDLLVGLDQNTIDAAKQILSLLESYADHPRFGPNKIKFELAKARSTLGGEVADALEAELRSKGLLK